MARYARVSSSVLLVGVVLIPVVAAAQPAAPGRDAPAQRDSHQGIVVLQFDDGTSGHYTHAFPILEKYGLKGSFGVVTGVFGRPGRLTAEQVVEMHRAGQEIHDHTLDHNAAFWGNPQQRESWKQQIEQSLSILKQLGIICKFLQANKLPVMVMADAVRAVQNTRKYVAATVEQIPNPGFSYDLDGNGRPDGYSPCGYAPAEITSPGGGRVAEFVSGTTTWIYGPEAGETTLTLTVRSADDDRRTITPVLTRAEINSRYEYRWSEKERCSAVTAGREWQTTQLPLHIGTDVDRVKIEFDINPAGKVYVGGLSWRLVPRGDR